MQKAIEFIKRTTHTVHHNVMACTICMKRFALLVVHNSSTDAVSIITVRIGIGMMELFYSARVGRFAVVSRSSSSATKSNLSHKSSQPCGERKRSYCSPFDLVLSLGFGLGSE